MFKSDEKGQGMVEYVLIIVLVAVVGLVVWGLLGDEIRTTLNTIIDTMSNATN
ncbi:MAG: Flp family type IVb pilin [Anaerolineales bacterium]|nr:Flp family type IVb pilin [Anaerolineales bacterium]